MNASIHGGWAEAESGWRPRISVHEGKRVSEAAASGKISLRWKIRPHTAERDRLRQKLGVQTSDWAHDFSPPRPPTKVEGREDGVW